jgi:3,4-dihydroxy 2-butanone 4-phosphate synthase/GTP cyclohydrolase II
MDIAGVERKANHMTVDSNVETQTGIEQDPVPPGVLDTVEVAIAEIAAGRMVIVVDDFDRENEGDLIMAAEKATPEALAFVIRHTGGVVCAPMPEHLADILELPPMTLVNEDTKGTAFTVTVDAADGITTGISAADRAVTLRRLADSATTASGLRRPGHVFPLRAKPGGVLERAGHTEAAVDLATLAGLSPVGIISEICHDDGTMARLPELRAFADQHGLTLISIDQLAAYRVAVGR